MAFLPSSDSLSPPTVSVVTVHDTYADPTVSRFGMLGMSFALCVVDSLLVSLSVMASVHSLCIF